MKSSCQSLFVVSALLVAGCASTAPSYRPIDLKADLDRETLQRYQAEGKDAGVSGANCHMATLEKTNWWLPALIAYWHRGSVEIMPGQDGQVYYMVSQTRGFGPLSVLYVAKQDATFDAKGRLLTDMSMSSVLWGHLAMLHEVRSRLDDTTWMTHNTSHWLHHLISVSDMNGMMGVSLFSAPNPLGVGD